MTPKKSTTPRRAPKPKPVEAWALLDDEGNIRVETCVLVPVYPDLVLFADGRIVAPSCKVLVSPILVPARKAATRGKDGRR